MGRLRVLQAAQQAAPRDKLLYTRRTMGIATSVMIVPATPITHVSRRAALANISTCRVCAMSTCPSTSGGAIRTYAAMASAVTAIPYNSGERKYTITRVDAAVSTLFNNHCPDSQNDPRTAESVKVTVSFPASLLP